jgi:hypothetical protein
MHGTTIKIGFISSLCILWSIISAACSKIQKLRQVLQSKCLLWIMHPRQIEEVVKVPTLLSNNYGSSERPVNSSNHCFFRSNTSPVLVIAFSSNVALFSCQSALHSARRCTIYLSHIKSLLHTQRCCWRDELPLAIVLWERGSGWMDVRGLWHLRYYYILSFASWGKP